MYGKFVKDQKFKAHDLEQNVCQEGDLVRIVESDLEPTEALVLFWLKKRSNSRA